jgi:molybdopterin/thiamine biosynthesis adenylyltransferase
MKHQGITTEQKQELENKFAGIEGEFISLDQCRQISSSADVSIRQIEIYALSKSIVPSRYQRNIGMYTIKGQSKLLQSKAIIVGLGGLGGNILEQIARAGIGTIVGCDPDVFDNTNLNRQLLSTEDAIGKTKASQAQIRAKQINSAISFHAHPCKFEQLTNEDWDGVDIVFDCLDNIPDRLTLAKKCTQHNCPLIHGAIAGLLGQVGIVWPHSNMLETYYTGQTEAHGVEIELGTPASTAAMTASYMASEGIQVLLGNRQKESLMHFFNLEEGDWENIKL